MISSACPGWICYAEKTLGSYILPYISSVKSPNKLWSSCPRKLYMPKAKCKTRGYTTRDYNAIFDNRKFLDLIQLKAVDFQSLEESPLDKLFANINEEGHLYGVHGSSGGYAETIYRHVAKVLLGQEVKGPIAFKTIRNYDFQEVSLEDDAMISSCEKTVASII
ncbi:hypothetical protein HAX54_053496 [Datura stramonium]|uniref:Iron hydrogenase large subunit C-terminal domain-containing protein n=1 Tax=Datura stramonium TaxID=4076 RepID=A0ABS8T2G7_DATST|nr:hypothetical protein [Datura stramonium]